MARDYKTRAAAPRSKNKQQASCWVWFLGGVLVGLFFSGLAWLKLVPSTAPFSVAQPPPERVEAAPRADVDSEPQAPKPRFDFYTILPEMEVVVPEPEPLPEPAPQTARSVAQPKPKTPDRYMLQMGSFRKFADADRLKASLALIGIEAEIQRVSINRGETFYRVRSGPYSREKVNALSSRLKSNRINSLVIKLKQ